MSLPLGKTPPTGYRYGTAPFRSQRSNDATVSSVWRRTTGSSVACRPFPSSAVTPPTTVAATATTAAGGGVHSDLEESHYLLIITLVILEEVHWHLMGDIVEVD